MKKIVLATDLGGTNLRMAAVDEDGSILSRVKYETPRSSEPHEIVETMAKAVKECRAELRDADILAIGAAVPGTIDFKRGLIQTAPNLPELNEFSIVGALEDKLGIKAILENDANAAAIGENWLGASKGFANSIMITLGTGVGGGVIIDGKVLRGIDGTAGEIGHINVEPEGHSCGCGSFGCLEQYASATAIVRMAKEIFGQDNNVKLDGLKEITSEYLFEQASAGNALARDIFRTQGYYMGIVLAGLINTLNPEVIVIGGGVAAGWDLFITSLREQIKVRSYKEPAERAEVVRAKLGDDAGILGIAKMGFEDTRSFQEKYE